MFNENVVISKGYIMFSNLLMIHKGALVWHNAYKATAFNITTE